jgi:hypothetical protein
MCRLDRRRWVDHSLFTESFRSLRVDLYWNEGSRLGMAIAWQSMAWFDVRARQGELHHD